MVETFREKQHLKKILDLNFFFFEMDCSRRSGGDIFLVKSTLPHIFFFYENFCKIIIFRLLLSARKFLTHFLGVRTAAGGREVIYLQVNRRFRTFSSSMKISVKSLFFDFYSQHKRLHPLFGGEGGICQKFFQSKGHISIKLATKQYHFQVRGPNCFACSCSTKKCSQTVRQTHRQTNTLFFLM